MKTIREVEKDIMEKPEHFRVYMGSKEYAKAKNVYETTRTVALFIKLEEAKLIELFGDRAADPPVEGMFKEEAVQKAFRECIRAHQTNELREYRPLTVRR